jgi:hypothetical protein
VRVDDLRARDRLGPEVVHDAAGLREMAAALLGGVGD